MIKWPLGRQPEKLDSHELSLPQLHSLIFRQILFFFGDNIKYFLLFVVKT